MPAAHLVTPDATGFEVFKDGPSFAFLIEHGPSGKKILFDLGLRKRFRELPPAIKHFLETAGWDVRVEKDVADILEEGGIPPSDIDAVVWSHYHWDHVGDMSLFPPETELVVGPRFQEHYMPGWPTNPDSSLTESDWEGRVVREISFTFNNHQLEIGGFRAEDFFGDGSFYLLDAPGHAVGHLMGLARVTKDSTSQASSDHDSFVLMGADICHFPGQFRPNAYNPLPQGIQTTSSIQTSYYGEIGCLTRTCKRGNEPFFHVPEFNAADVMASSQSIAKLQCFDAAENVFIVIAHDKSVLGLVNVFPDKLNDWKSKGYRDHCRWGFLNEFGIHCFEDLSQENFRC